MSGRKHHYIPRFFMKPFAYRQNGTFFYLKVYKKNSSYESEAMGVGAEKDLYGPPEDSLVDEMITKMEFDIQNILKNLQVNIILNEEVAVLINHLLSRTKCFNECSISVYNKFIEYGFNLIDGISLDKVENKLIEKVKQELADKAPHKVKKAKKEKTYAEDLFKKRKAEIGALKWNSMVKASFTETLNECRDSFRKMNEDINSIVKHEWFECLKKLPNSPRIDFYKKFSYSLICNDNDEFILGDCIAIGLYKDGIFRLPLQDLDETNRLEKIYFPISPNVAILGVRINSTSNIEFSTKEINKNLIEISSSFVTSKNGNICNENIGLRSSYYIPQNLDSEIKKYLNIF